MSERPIFGDELHQIRLSAAAGRPWPIPLGRFLATVDALWDRADLAERKLAEARSSPGESRGDDPRPTHGEVIALMKALLPLRVRPGEPLDNIARRLVREEKLMRTERDEMVAKHAEAIRCERCRQPEAATGTTHTLCDGCAPGERERALEEALSALWMEAGRSVLGDEVLKRADARIRALASPSRTDVDASWKGGGR